MFGVLTSKSCDDLYVNFLQFCSSKAGNLPSSGIKKHNRGFKKRRMGNQASLSRMVIQPATMVVNDMILSTKEKCWEMAYDDLGNFVAKCKNPDTKIIYIYI